MKIEEKNCILLHRERNERVFLLKKEPFSYTIEDTNLKAFSVDGYTSIFIYGFLLLHELFLADRMNGERIS